MEAMIGIEPIQDEEEHVKDRWNRDGDFYDCQADSTKDRQERVNLLQRARDCYLRGGATKDVRRVERAIDRMR